MMQPALSEACESSACSSVWGRTSDGHLFGLLRCPAKSGCRQPHEQSQPSLTELSRWPLNRSPNVSEPFVVWQTANCAGENEYTQYPAHVQALYAWRLVRPESLAVCWTHPESSALNLNIVNNYRNPKSYSRKRQPEDSQEMLYYTIYYILYTIYYILYTIYSIL